MSELRIRNKNRFSSVKDSLLEDKSLSLEARAVAAWLSGRSDGFTVRVEAMREYYMGISEKRWKSIRGELEKVGWWRSTRTKSGARGRFVWAHEFSTDGFEDGDAPTSPSIPPSGRDGAGMDAQGKHADGRHAQGGGYQKDGDQEEVYQEEKKQKKGAAAAVDAGKPLKPAANLAAWIDDAMRRADGPRRPGAPPQNRQRDLDNADFLRWLAGWLGEQVVVDAVAGEQWLSGARKKCDDAGLPAAAMRAEAAQDEHLAALRRQASLDASAAEIPRGDTQFLDSFIRKSRGSGAGAAA